MDERRMDGDVRKYGCMDWWMDDGWMEEGWMGM